ncbi:hypothetical protein [Selenomonas sputigena]|uniref:Uncharacterized protein n=1 Tax=Selenomonas sputigena (strain ATCC 35185 / DSM 20758 / CCUG 44933 / VPI D19B-28) TaxID=546271 RepID=C9LUV2_SELS3|nr:hypothetical protein [Selenomonas sputigena]EEX77368.1 hypothetical protein SELSPUOL_01242 [Selenomonas sputigena ATCC 35185]
MAAAEPNRKDSLKENGCRARLSLARLTSMHEKSIMTKERVTGVLGASVSPVKIFVLKEEPPQPRSGSFFYLQSKQMKSDVHCQRKRCNEDRQLFIKRHAHHLLTRRRTDGSPVTETIIRKR